MTEGRRVSLCVKTQQQIFQLQENKNRIKGEIEKFKVKVGDFRALFKQVIEHADTAETQ